MNEYRQQQLAAAALIDSGNYTAEQVAAVYGWIKPKHKPLERAAPEQSAQTGHNQTLTPRRKCGIIKAIARHVRRWKRKQEGKAMIKLWKFTVFTYVNTDYTRYFVTKQAAEAAEAEARQKGNYTSEVKYAGSYNSEKVHVFGKDDCYIFPNYAKENEAFF